VAVVSIQWLGRSPEIISSALEWLGIAYAVLVTGNVGEHWTQRGKAAPNAKTTKTQGQ
jgi:hypothetical protein